MDVFVAFTNLILENNPGIVKEKYVRPASERVRVISRLDVLTSTPGIVFEEAWQHRVSMNYKGQSLGVVSLTDLIASKRASGGEVDLEDVRILESKNVNSTRED